MKPGIELIAEERTRQIEKEGWTEEHDDKHFAGMLSDAAAVYATTKPIYSKQDLTTGGLVELPTIVFESLWPFEVKWYKPTSRKRDLIKAGALIAAEIDRLQRAEQ